MENTKIYPALLKKIQNIANEEKIPTIVMFNSANAAAGKEYIRNLVGSQGIKYDYSIIPGVAVELTPEQIKQVSAHQNVAYVEHDGEVCALLNTARPSFGVDQAVWEWKLTGNRYGPIGTYSKYDVVIAVIDTGIDINNIDLANGKVIGWKDEVNNLPTPYDDNGHGTHVSSIAAGAGLGKWKYRGVAFGASLVGVKVLNQFGSGSYSQIIAGVQWCVTNKNVFNIRVINMSLGGPSNQPMIDAVNYAVDAGIVVCAAAGNSGPSIGTVDSPGDAEKVITVGAMADLGKGGFYLANFSSRGPTQAGLIKPDICGPGVNIIAARAGTRDQYIALSGTSMATPFVAGVAALILNANPSLTPQQVKDIIIYTAVDWAPSGPDIDTGYGRLNAYDAIRVAFGASCTEKLDLPNVLRATGTLHGTGNADMYDFEVTEKCTPVAVTMTLQNQLSTFYLEAYDIFGNLIASSTANVRQETLKFTAACCGRYRLQVYSHNGSGTYYLNVSAFGRDLDLLETNVPYSSSGIRAIAAGQNDSLTA